jgi:hypothetical protein
MTNRPGLGSATIFVLVAALVGCSSTDPEDATAHAGAGGLVAASGGAAPATGGGVGTGGVPGTGGRSAAGGTTVGTGGISVTGGRSGTGGGAAGIGGTLVGSGGLAATGGTGGVESDTGGTPATGGTNASGGTGPATGGTPGTGGAETGGTTSVDPDVSAAINACMDKLPWGARDMSADERAPIVAAIVHACAVFAPPGEEWQTYCQMFLVGAINAESSYDTRAGTQGAGDDPSVGLLQIRFGSTVRDFADYGPFDALKRAGCDFGTVTSSDSYATKGDQMLDVNCNLAIGTWYYFIFGSGNGGPDVVWVYQYCGENAGVAGNLHIGMACHLMGAEAAHSSLSGADSYYDNIKSWFDPCVSYTGTHPFERTIEPDRDKYCR